MTEPSTTTPGQRKTKTGRVVSDKMDKTIVVSVERLARHRLYKRVIRLTTKFKAHDETNDAQLGDLVQIEESRPLSATKRWRLVSVLQRAGDHGLAGEIVADEAATSEAIHAAAHPGRTRDDAAADTTGAATDAAPTDDAAAPADDDAAAPADDDAAAPADDVVAVAEATDADAATAETADAAGTADASDAAATEDATDSDDATGVAGAPGATEKADDDSEEVTA
jgi:small subunit ribosomal protein S17